jgi:hypothetical protein
MSASTRVFVANQSDVTSTSLDTNVTTTVGDGAAVAIFWKGTTSVTVSSVTGGGIYNESTAALARPTDGFLQFYACHNITSAVTNVRVQWTASATNVEAFCWGISGGNTTKAINISATGTSNSGTTTQTASFTPTSTGIILSFASADPLGTTSADTGYTSRYNLVNQGIVVQDKSFVSGAQTTHAFYQNAVTKAGILSILFNDAPAAGGGANFVPRFYGDLDGIGKAFFSDRLSNR